MIEGVLRHCTDAEIQSQYVDSRGQSEVAFAFCSLLGFDLLPRLKGIARQKLYLPFAEMREGLSELVPILARTIDCPKRCEHRTFCPEMQFFGETNYDDAKRAIEPRGAVFDRNGHRPGGHAFRLHRYRRPD